MSAGGADKNVATIRCPPDLREWLRRRAARSVERYLFAEVSAPGAAPAGWHVAYTCTVSHSTEVVIG